MVDNEVSDVNPSNAGTVFRRQNPTSKDGPCTEIIDP